CGGRPSLLRWLRSLDTWPPSRPPTSPARTSGSTAAWACSTRRSGARDEAQGARRGDWRRRQRALRRRPTTTHARRRRHRPRTCRARRRDLAREHLPGLLLRHPRTAVLLLVRAERSLVATVRRAGRDPRLPRALRRTRGRAGRRPLRRDRVRRAVVRRPMG